jgi:hypothetical protein
MATTVYEREICVAALTWGDRLWFLFVEGIEINQLKQAKLINQQHKNKLQILLLMG